MLPAAGAREAPRSANICKSQRENLFPPLPRKKQRGREKRKWQTADNLYFTPTDKITMEKDHCPLETAGNQSQDVPLPIQCVKSTLWPLKYDGIFLKVTITSSIAFYRPSYYLYVKEYKYILK